MLAQRRHHRTRPRREVRQRTWRDRRRPENTVREAEAVTLRSLHKKFLLRLRDLIDQCPERFAKPVQLLRIALIDTSDITAKLHFSRPGDSPGILA
ncbi:MAG TPA: hypothetical protein VGP41_16105 [Candidatus Lustribacter sp.]|nr:hypothetical protein [Candidatus Lustribacter sp.]